MVWEWESGGAQVLAIAFALAAIALLGFTLWRLRSSGPRAQVAEVAELRATMLHLRTEFDRLADEMSGRMDAKVRALRQLLHEASVAIEQLRRLKGDEFARTASPPSSELVVPPAAITAPAAPTAQPARAPADSIDLRAERYAHVYSLADTGLDPAQISAETGMHRGEVELVLSLRRKKYRADQGGRVEPTPSPYSKEVRV